MPIVCLGCLAVKKSERPENENRHAISSGTRVDDEMPEQMKINGQKSMLVDVY